MLFYLHGMADMRELIEMFCDVHHDHFSIFYTYAPTDNTSKIKKTLINLIFVYECTRVDINEACQ